MLIWISINRGVERSAHPLRDSAIYVRIRTE